MAADAQTKRKIEALLRKKFCDNSMVDVSDGFIEIQIKDSGCVIGH